MKRNLLVLSAMLVFSSLAISQTTILDFEAAATSTQFQFFGGALEGIVGDVIDNPNSSGINTSSKVFEFKKAGDAPTWGGGFTEPNPTTAVDLTSPSKVCVDVHFDHIGNIALKLEQSSDGGSDWITTQVNTKMNEWEQICFDVTAPSIEDASVMADGHTYARVVFFTDFGTEGTGSESVTYLDNIVVQSTVGTNDFTQVDDLFSMNPNLVQDQALITFGANASDARTLSVVSANGAVVKRHEVSSSAFSYELNVADWAPGLYFAQVQEGKKRQVIKFLVY